ncbi:Flagellar hook protein flgE [gamma proteobacterium IMCC1989]|nr:Flagellar hook protein flgE [gamma proteobacterium IMCC1989]
MPFNVALSGIRAANSDLRVTGNNIANASTTGFKESRTEFGDIYSTSALGSGLNQPGSGVRVQDIAQQFGQGNISFTENSLDLSISGSGFFVTSFAGDQSFTRAGTFGLDQEGFIVNNTDARLQGFDADSSGNISGLIGDIQIQTTNIQPTATTGVDIALNVDSREPVIQTTGTRYLSSGGTAAANENGYTAQSLDFTNPSGATVTFNTSASDNTFDTVSSLNSLSGVTATSTATATLSTWSAGLNVTINGASLTNTGISQATATEITNLPGLTATYDAGAGTIAVVSTIGDLVFGAAGSGGADQLLTVTGSSGLPQTLEFDGAGDLVAAGNLAVSGTFTGIAATAALNQSSSGRFIAGASTIPLDTSGAGPTDYDFSITIDGLASNADISLPASNYVSYAAMASALQTAIDGDVNLNGLGVTVAYDTDHFVFTSPTTTGASSTVAITAVGANANDLGIATGSAVAGTDADAYDFSITVDGVASAADISLPVASYASYTAMAAALETAINADTNISGVSVTFDTDHFVITSVSTGTTSTVALTAVGADANDLGIAGATSSAGVSDITVGGIITLELDEGYSLTDNSGTPLFDNAPVEFVNNSFDPTSPETYNHSTSVTVYDSLGNSHVMQQYFIKQPYDPSDPATFANHWEMAVQIDGQNVGDPVISAPTTATVATYDLFFTANGTLNTALSDSLLISNWTPIDENGNEIGALGPLNVASGGSVPVAEPAINSNFEISMDDSTQVGSDFEVRTLDQNGSTTGRLVGIDVDDSGIIFARYTNGENQVLAQVALADFANVQGLQSDGDTAWVQTFESGEPIIGGPGTASLGLIQSGALEDSNVDLSEQLVNLIIAQRNFQANAKTIETADTITQTIINLR